MNFISETQIRVRYAETDQMGMAHHSNFIIWFEAGRVEAMRELDCDYKLMEAEGCHLPVINLNCRYRSPARYDDLLTIRTGVKRLRQGMVHFGYEAVRAADGVVLAEGETVHLAVDGEAKRCSLPPQYFSALRKAREMTPDDDDEP